MSRTATITEEQRLATARAADEVRQAGENIAEALFQLRKARRILANVRQHETTGSLDYLASRLTSTDPEIGDLSAEVDAIAIHLHMRAEGVR